MSAQKGRTTWMKGRKHTEESKSKMSSAHKGKVVSPETRIKIGLGSKGNKYNLGHKASEETKQKMRMAKLGVKKSESARQNMRRVRLGEKSHLWKGGITPINKAIRRTLQYRLWRTAIFIRDNRTCVECGAKTRDIQADHYPISFSAILNKLIVEQGLENLLEKALKYESMLFTRKKILKNLLLDYKIYERKTNKR